MKAKVKQCKSDVVVVPGCLTNHIKPADVSWNKPFKEAYRSKSEVWFSSGEMLYNPADNMRTPRKLLCVQWVLNKNLIKNSFLACGISVPIDSSQDSDSEIHCMRGDDVAFATKTGVEDSKRQPLELSSNIVDPFDKLHIEDEKKLENNEAILDTDCDTDDEPTDS